MNKIMSMKGKLKDKIHKLIDKWKHFFNENYIELVLFSGLFLIILASFLLNIILGLYILGAILVLFAVFLFKFPERRR